MLQGRERRSYHTSNAHCNMKGNTMRNTFTILTPRSGTWNSMAEGSQEVFRLYVSSLKEALTEAAKMTANGEKPVIRKGKV